MDTSSAEMGSSQMMNEVEAPGPAQPRCAAAARRKIHADSARQRSVKVHQFQQMLDAFLDLLPVATLCTINGSPMISETVMRGFKLA